MPARLCLGSDAPQPILGPQALGNFEDLTNFRTHVAQDDFAAAMRELAASKHERNEELRAKHFDAGQIDDESFAIAALGNQLVPSCHKPLVGDCQDLPDEKSYDTNSGLRRGNAPVFLLLLRAAFFVDHN